MIYQMNELRARVCVASTTRVHSMIGNNNIVNASNLATSSIVTRARAELDFFFLFGRGELKFHQAQMFKNDLIARARASEPYGSRL